MAYSDYTHCAVCDCKVFYDATIQYEHNTGFWAALCINCDKTYELVVRNKETGEITEAKNIFIEGIKDERAQEKDHE